MTRIDHIKQLLTTRLDTLGHIVDVGIKHFDDEAALLGARLALDMLPFGTQISFTCNQARWFALWCAGEEVTAYPAEVPTLDQARGMLADAKARVAAIQTGDEKLAETKRVGLGPGRYCMLTGQRYVDDFLLPNMYFHITAAYCILRNAGVAIGKQDYLTMLRDDIRHDA